MSAPALEIKSRLLSVTRMRVLRPDIEAIEAQLATLARQMPQAVQGMPVVLEADSAENLGGLIGVLKGVGMQPLGVTDGALNEAARSWGLAVLPPEGASRAPRAAAAPAATAPAARKPTRLLTEPVRGGQQVYAAETDLIALNMVAAGAEVIADGCVHVYGALRGRAMAGAQGDVGARIFCRRFEPELVAVAGVYAVAEQLHGNLHGKPVQVFLQDGKLKIERLDW